MTDINIHRAEVLPSDDDDEDDPYEEFRNE